MINWERVHELQHDIGADAFGTLSELFLEEVDAAVLALAETGTTSAQVREERFHALKGAALNLGFDTLAAACARAEVQAARGGDTGGHAHMIAALYAQSRRAFVAHTAVSRPCCAAAQPGWQVQSRGMGQGLKGAGQVGGGLSHRP